MQKILLTGPESTGKTTLAQQLAQQYACPWVAEFARGFLTQLNRPYTQADLLPILIGQLDTEDAAQRQYGEASFLFCDTGPEVLYIWSMEKYGSVHPLIERVLQHRSYHRRLLCYPDLPWEADPLREAPTLATRIHLFDAYEALFQRYGLAYEVVRGSRADFSLG